MPHKVNISPIKSIFALKSIAYNVQYRLYNFSIETKLFTLSNTDELPQLKDKINQQYHQHLEYITIFLSYSRVSFSTKLINPCYKFINTIILDWRGNFQRRILISWILLERIPIHLENCYLVLEFRLDFQ